MTPQPPASSEGSSLPPRHRPSLGSLTQDTTELDLWAFDDEADLEGASTPTQAVVLTPRAFGASLPAPREIALEKTAESGAGQAFRHPAGEDSIRINVTKAPVKNRAAGAVARPATPEGEFDDLEAWDKPPVPAASPHPPAAVVPEFVQAANPPEWIALGAPAPIPLDSGPPPEVPAAEVPADDNELSPVAPQHAVPMSLRPRLRLSLIERIGLVGLLVLLLGGGGAIVIFSLTRLPTETKRAKANDFPIKGKLLTINSAKSYWRTPILEGPAMDTVRRGTQLLPVLEISVSGGPAAVRVLFRNEDHTLVGDAVTRTVSGGDILKIPATAGFDDLGMHAAYRTGESKPWTIEVLEAPSADTTGKDFSPLFEINISTDRR